MNPEEDAADGRASHRVNLARDMYHLRRENNPKRREAVTFSCLAKLFCVNSTTLNHWRQALRHLLDLALDEKPAAVRPLVIGLAESGIIPSALFHQVLKEVRPEARWICSTRRPEKGLRFSETHSHAPRHSIPVPLTPPSELWFVEDEITTGETLLRLALRLCRHTGVRDVRFLAFADARSGRRRKHFEQALKIRGVRSALYTLHIDTHGDDRPVIPVATGAVSGSFFPTEVCRNPHDRKASETGWHFPGFRPGRKEQGCSDPPLPTDLSGSLLAVGEAVDLGLRIAQTSPDLSLRHITLSPWEVDRVHIHTRLRIDSRYYLYNFHTLKPPLHLLWDPIDEAAGLCALNLLTHHGFGVNPLTLT